MNNSSYFWSLILTSLFIANTGMSPVQSTEAFEGECASELVDFKDTSGLSLKYPRGWSVKRKPDKDTLAKFSGRPSPNVDAEIAVSLINDGGLNVDNFAKTFNGLMFSKLGGVRVSSLQRVYVGSSGRLAGQLQSVSFTMHGMPVYQEYLFIAAKNKMLVLTLTTQNWQRTAVEGSWKCFLNTIDAPDSLISPAPINVVKEFKPQTIATVCNTYSSSACAPIIKPVKTMTLDQKIKAVLPRTEEERFLQIPWHTDLLFARVQSERIGKPMFIWIMDGNVLGAT